MKALILNSGLGKRMGDLTKNNPKCLVKIKAEETILGYQIEQLIKNNIFELIITTGPFSQQIKDFVKERFPELKVKYVHSEIYDKTNYIYSMYLAKKELDDDFILLHGDLVWEDEVLRKVIQYSSPDAVLIDRSVPPPEKDFKGKIEKGKVTEVGVNTFGENCYFLAPLYKLSKATFQKWLSEIDKFIARGDNKVYAENALNNILGELNLIPIYFDGEFCTEIDNPQDLDKVKDHFR